MPLTLTASPQATSHESLNHARATAAEAVVQDIVRQAQLGRIAPLHPAGTAALDALFRQCGRPEGYKRPAMVRP